MRIDYSKMQHKSGYNMLYLATEWFKMSNDDFYRKYGFNFNPHDYYGLYEVARKKVHGI